MRGNKGAFTATPNLRRARLMLGLTQEELADRAGIDRGHLSYIERGVRAIRPNTARALAKALRLTVTEALNRNLFTLVWDVNGSNAGGSRGDSSPEEGSPHAP